MNAYHRFVAHRQKESTAHGHGGGGHSRETAVKFGAEWAVLSEQEKKVGEGELRSSLISVLTAFSP